MKKIDYNDCINNYEEGLFYYNNLSIPCADPGAIYVSEEDDPVYGGWFYTYFTGEIKLDEGDRFAMSAYRCYRSRDLENFELVGRAGKGGCLVVRDDSWARRFFWAPEVIFDKKSKKYYIYFSAGSKVGDETTEYTSEQEDRWAGLYLGIGVSDCPMGPFEFVTSEEYPDGKNLNGDVISRFNPPINFERKLCMPHYWSAIDVSPFFAADGNFYIYFAKHVDKYHSGICIYGMKMKDMITPDYSTLTQLTKSCYRTVYQSGDYTTAVPLCKDMNEGGVNEGPFMTYHDGKYYLTYSRFGYGARDYDISQAISDSPLGPFVKLPHGAGNPALGLCSTNDFMAGNGHHNFAYAGDEIIAFYHSHTNPVRNYDEEGRFLGRVLSVDKVHFVYNKDLGYEIMQGSGPSSSPQPLAAINAKYVNVADKAALISNAIGGERYLVDDIFVSQPFAEHMQAEFKGNAVISFEYEKPIDLKAVMVYNPYSYEHAFSCVDKIVLKSDSGEAFVMENIQCAERDVNRSAKFMRQGGAAIAALKETLKVTSIEIYVSQKYDTSNDTIKISDVKILAEK